MEKQYLTVTALTKYIRRKFESDQHLKDVWLQAEISNFKHHSRGHMYFTLKDEKARISAVMFASSNRHLKFRPEDGMKVLVLGDISVYEPQGQYQIYVQNMQPDGIGSLYLAYEELKKKLDQQGLFHPERKRPIPQFPKRIAIITSPTGAAVRDIITTLKRRYPMARRTIIPVSVQGEHAAPSIVKGIEYANQLNDFDTIIVGRGGGSIEELWAFNEEEVARAITQSKTPVISAVGHETDFTISDFVADLRAPTPTAAAELAVPSLIDLTQQVQNLNQRLNQSMKYKIEHIREKIKSIDQSYAFKYPIQMTRQKEQDLDRVVNQLNKSAKRFVQDQKTRYSRLGEQIKTYQPRQVILEQTKELEYKMSRLNQQMTNIKEQKGHNFQNQLNKLTILNPLETMRRGYSIPYKDKRIVKSVKHVEPGDAIHLSLSDGQLDCQVWGIEEKEEEL
ncbi:exodeoxyribonuclease VII large subunit [Aquisalibacillus elongatus]|uniref:Exodeoxyribonuclease 7 large subunit n=1 Tax=Aquisalibacillus elongatus TaxID=485577 RepID=A0A3N5C0R7_9BACI|nr:exodeoxyribonuclease VII large subunit [Aquisalibacillus elongatus]RPF55668.1 exodeoxyribonuclease VII large subunit [Aquisalibacillus elongatus]